MTRRDHMDRAFATALEPELAARVQRPSKARRADPHLRRQVIVAVVVAALVLGASASAISAGLLRDRGGPAVGSEPTPTITVAGRAMRDVGTVTWSDAVLLSPTSIRIDAAPYPVHGDVSNCGAFAVRPHVVESDGEVAITSEAYDYVPPSRVPPGTSVGCGAVGRGPLPVVVRLAAPLGERDLVDPTDGARHAVLDPATIPVPAALPAGYRPSAWVRWQEHPGAATRIWYSLTPQKGSYTDFSVTTLPGRTPLTGSPPTRTLDPIEVHGHEAEVTQDQDSYDWSASISWVVGSTVVTVSTHGNIRNHRSLAELEEVARSTPDP